MSLSDAGYHNGVYISRIDIIQSWIMNTDSSCTSKPKKIENKKNSKNY